MSYYGLSNLCMFYARMNSKMYWSLLDENVKPFGSVKPGDEWIYQRDNFAVRISKQALNWLEENNINVITWHEPRDLI